MFNEAIPEIILTFIAGCIIPLLTWILSKQYNIEKRLSKVEGKVDIIIRLLNGFSHSSNPGSLKEPVSSNNVKNGNKKQ